MVRFSNARFWPDCRPAARLEPPDLILGIMPEGKALRTTAVDEHMAPADLMIGTPGGLTLSEALARSQRLAGGEPASECAFRREW
jgi:hypothetical protein